MWNSFATKQRRKYETDQSKTKQSLQHHHHQQQNAAIKYNSKQILSWYCCCCCCCHCFSCLICGRAGWPPATKDTDTDRSMKKDRDKDENQYYRMTFTRPSTQNFSPAISHNEFKNTMLIWYYYLFKLDWGMAWHGMPWNVCLCLFRTQHAHTQTCIFIYDDSFDECCIVWCLRRIKGDTCHQGCCRPGIW